MTEQEGGWTEPGFKALLFIAAGAVIHALADQQDMRRYGGLVTVLPLVYSSLVVGSLSLIAVPYLTGWYSKDGVLEMAIGSYTVSGLVVYGVGTLVAGLTAYYSVRLLALSFYRPAASSFSTYQHAHESSLLVVGPLVILSLFAIGLGYASSDLYRGLGTDFLSTAAPMSALDIHSVDAEFGVPTALKLMPFAATITGSVLSFVLFIEGQAWLARLTDGAVVRAAYRFMTYQWNWDALIIRGVIDPSLRLGHGLSKVMDRGVLEAVGPYGLQQSLSLIGQEASYYSTERLTDYAMYIVLAMLLAVAITATLFSGAGSSLLPGVEVAPSMLVMLLATNVVSLVMASTSEES